MPSSLLSKKIKKRVSNIAFPGHPEHYEKLLIKYKKEYSKDTPILVFYFEGNDFVQKNSNINKADNISKNKTDNIFEWIERWGDYGVPLAMVYILSYRKAKKA